MIICMYDIYVMYSFYNNLDISLCHESSLHPAYVSMYVSMYDELLETQYYLYAIRILLWLE